MISHSTITVSNVREVRLIGSMIVNVVHVVIVIVLMIVKILTAIILVVLTHWAVRGSVIITLGVVVTCQIWRLMFPVVIII